MTISAMVRNARQDKLAQEEMITTAMFAMAFVGGMFVGGYAVIKLMGW
jgi:hypothetical protein